MKTLKEISVGKDTDKGTTHDYLTVYEQIFEPLRLLPITLLEIGVDTGGSIAMWLEYFPNARIFGMDIINQDNIQHPRFTYVDCHQTDFTTVPTLFEPSSLDIVIDDGSHFAEDQALTQHMLWPALKNDGLYVIEDLQHVGRGSRNSILYWSAHSIYRNVAAIRVYDRRHRDNQQWDDVMVVLQKKV